MTNSNRAHDNSHRQNDAGGERPPPVGELMTENRKLRERVDELETGLAEIRDELDEGDVEDRRDGPESTTEATGPAGQPVDADGTAKLVTSGGQPTKVIGKLGDTDGIGVLGEATGDGSASRGVHGITQSSSDGATGVEGEATAASGETYGVRGETNSSSGYGLYTPDDARVDGNINSPSDIDLDPDGDDNFREIFMGENARFFYNPLFEGNSILGADNADMFWLGTPILDLVESNAVLRFSDDTPQTTAGPVAKGHVMSDATLSSGQNVNSVSWSSLSNWYHIDIEETTFNSEDYATMVTPQDDTVTARASVTGGNSLLIQFGDDGQHQFQFVTHKLTDGSANISTSGSDTSSDDVSSDEPSQP